MPNGEYEGIERRRVDRRIARIEAKLAKLELMLENIMRDLWHMKGFIGGIVLIVSSITVAINIAVNWFK